MGPTGEARCRKRAILKLMKGVELPLIAVDAVDIYKVEIILPIEKGNNGLIVTNVLTC